MANNPINSWIDACNKRLGQHDIEGAYDVLCQASNISGLADAALNAIDSVDWSALLAARHRAKEQRELEMFGMFAGGFGGLLQAKMVNSFDSGSDLAPKDASLAWKGIRASQQSESGVVVTAEVFLKNYLWRRCWLTVTFSLQGAVERFEFWVRPDSNEVHWPGLELKCDLQQILKVPPCQQTVELVVTLRLEDPLRRCLGELPAVFPITPSPEQIAQPEPDKVRASVAQDSDSDGTWEERDRAYARAEAAEAEARREREGREQAEARARESERRASDAEQQARRGGSFDQSADPLVAAFSELGLAPGATFEDVKVAHRRLVMQFHPDRAVKLPQAQREFCEARCKKVQAAFNYLSVHFGG